MKSIRKRLHQGSTWAAISSLLMGSASVALFGDGVLKYVAAGLYFIGALAGVAGILLNDNSVTPTTPPTE